jgi:hypothetical protein
MLNEDDYHKDKNFKPIPQQYFCKFCNTVKPEKCFKSTTFMLQCVCNDCIGAYNVYKKKMLTYRREKEHYFDELDYEQAKITNAKYEHTQTTFGLSE